MRAIGKFFGAIGRFLWRFMVVFSFIVNIILVGVILILGVLIFNIKNDVADPLLKGLHSSFVGLDEATIDWTIPVRDSVQAQFTLPLEQETQVVLTDDVPLTVNANISGPVSIVGARVALTLPKGTVLPVALDLDVPVDEEIPVNLDVRAVIPLEQTQLHDPFQNLRYTFEPIILALDNLPDNFGEASSFGRQLLSGQPPNLFEPSPYVQDPWAGYSRTSGLGYDLLAESLRLNAPGEPASVQGAAPGDVPTVLLTGIVPEGGIPALDAQVRQQLYANDASPEEITAQARQQLEALGVPADAYTGNLAGLLEASSESQPASDGSNAAPAQTGELRPDSPPQPIFTPMPSSSE